MAILLVLMIIASIAEVLSLGIVLPFLGLLVDPARVFANSLVRSLVSDFGISEAHQLLMPMTIIFILGAIFSGGMRLLLLWVQTRLGFAIGADLSAQIYERTLYQPYSTHIARNSSYVINGIANQANSVIYNTLLPVLVIASSSLILLGVLLMFVVIDPIVALLSFGGFGGIYVLLIFLTKKRLRRDSKCVSVQSTQVIKVLQEGLGGIRDVLIDGTQAAYCAIYMRADLSMRRSQANIKIIGASPRFVIESLGMALMGIISYVLVKRGDGIVGFIPLLGILALGAQRLLPLLQQLYVNWSTIRGGTASLLDVLELLDQPLPEYINQPYLACVRFKDAIELKAVRYRYSAEGPWVLDRVNLEISRGMRIGFVGSTGSGKSTLLDLIMGLLQATAGQLSVDGVLITEQNYRSWQSLIAHVPQVVFLADATIAENIAFGIPPERIDLDRVKDAARQAQIAETIESWKSQYDTLTGERGIALSGGQRQRIGIARALYKKAEVIVFDEATSALDNETERAVMRSINGIGKDVTILMVAHRLSTLESCDKIVQLEQGKIKQVATYGKMIAAERKSVFL